MCGTQAIDDNSTFCNKCGAQLIQNNPENKNHDVCPNCGIQILNKDSVFCLQCGSPVSANYSQATVGSPSTGGKTTIGEAEQSKNVSLFPAITTINPSHKSDYQKSKSQKPWKRTSMVLPALLLFIVFLVILLVISQTGILGPLSSLGSIPASQEQMIVPANGTRTQTPTPNPIVTSFVTTMVSTTQAAIQNAVVTSTPTPPVTTRAPTTSGARKNLLETAEADGRFTTLVAAVKAADLNATLSDPDSHFTVFAPTDDAFRNLSGSIDPLLKDPQGDLLQILLYHIVSGNVTAADLEKLTSVETLQGGTLQISVSNGIVTVNGATVIVTDIECSNGVIHVVDTVMLPPA